MVNDRFRFLIIFKFTDKFFMNIFCKFNLQNHKIFFLTTKEILPFSNKFMKKFDYIYIAKNINF